MLLHRYPNSNSRAFFFVTFGGLLHCVGGPIFLPVGCLRGLFAFSFYILLDTLIDRQLLRVDFQVKPKQNKLFSELNNMHRARIITVALIKLVAAIGECCVLHSVVLNHHVRVCFLNED